MVFTYSYSFFLMPPPNTCTRLMYKIKPHGSGHSIIGFTVIYLPPRYARIFQPCFPKQSSGLDQSSILHIHNPYACSLLPSLAVPNIHIRHYSSLRASSIRLFLSSRALALFGPYLAILASRASSSLCFFSFGASQAIDMK